MDQWDFGRVEKVAKINHNPKTWALAGIFKRIKDKLDLLDERHAILELAKGKLTTDPENHTGEGIFFSSRMFDEYAILSGEVYFSH